MGYGDSAQCLLGNHDLSLLAVAHGRRAPHRNDTMDKVLMAPDRGEPCSSGCAISAWRSARMAC